jgi:hypothetical protein
LSEALRALENGIEEISGRIYLYLRVFQNWLWAEWRLAIQKVSLNMMFMMKVNFSQSFFIPVVMYHSTVNKGSPWELR